MDEKIVVALQRHFRTGEENTSASDLIHSFGRASHAMLYSLLYLPELVMLSESVLLAWSVPNDQAKERFMAALNNANMSRESCEASFNFVELGYLFDVPGRDTSDEEDVLLAQQLADAWKGHLCARFPNRNFIVEILPAEQTGSTVGIHFFERR